MDIRDLIEQQIRPQIRQPLWESWFIKEKIGSGSFSVVYRIEAQRPGSVDEAALKVEAITAEGQLFSDEERKTTFLNDKRSLAVNEAQIMKKLRDCPYIVRYEEEHMQELYVDGEFEGYYYLIRMELLQNVFEQMKSKTFDCSERNVLKLASEVGQGLKAAHDIGIIHRDIKPENMFVSASGIYKLGDFNISKKAVSTRTYAGTQYYMAPEIYWANANLESCYTTQADIYSFGLCLYQMMNNNMLPFEDQTDPTTACDKRMNGEIPPLPCNASKGFADIIMKACAYDYQQRYRTVDEMLHDINEELAHLPQQTKRSSGTVYAEDPFAANKTVYAEDPFSSNKTVYAEEPIPEKKQAYSNQTAPAGGVKRAGGSPAPAGGNRAQGQVRQNSAGSGPKNGSTKTVAALVVILLLLLGGLVFLVLIMKNGNGTDDSKSDSVTDTLSEAAGTAPVSETAPTATESAPAAVPPETVPLTDAVTVPPAETVPPASPVPAIGNLRDAVASVRCSSQLGDIVAGGKKRNYSVWNVMDGDLSTCWSEGVDGYGAGEKIQLLFATTYRVSSVTIYNGLETKQELFEKNGRVQEMTVSFSGGEQYRFMLNDGWGSAVSTFTLPQPADTSYIELTINSTYPGTAYEDTCISEIELH